MRRYKQVEWARREKSSLFFPLAWLFKTVVWCRNILYDFNVLKSKEAPLLVVSIGNITVGGSGKTQVALLLAEHLEDVKVAILSRGYKGKGENRKFPLCVDIEKHQAYETGDEPWLLASRLPRALVVVHKKRYKAALVAQKLGAVVALLDDGMQHRQLKRNIEIVVLNGPDPLGGGAFIPRGFLRDSPERLAQADLIMSIGKLQCEKRIRKLSSAPIVQAEIAVSKIWNMEGKEIVDLAGKKVGLFCGVAHPERVEKTIRELGVDLVASHFLPDHFSMSAKELHEFATLCKERGADYLLCTEKDKDKLPKVKSLPLQVAWMEVHLQFINGESAWVQLLTQIKNRLQGACR